MEMFFSEVGAYLLAFDARAVVGIGDAQEAGADAIDLVRALGAESPSFPGLRPRRVLQVAARGGTMGVLAGESVWAGTLPYDALVELPALVAERLRAAGIRGLFLRSSGRFGYVLDPEAL